MKYRLAIFDMDGTLLNTLPDIYASYSRSLKRFGIPDITKDELRRLIGYSIEIIMDKTMPKDVPQEKKDAFLADYKEYFAIHNSDETREFPGTTDLIRRLRSKGILTAIVSNNSGPTVEKLCDVYFPGLFDSIVGAEGLRAKPEPDTIFAALERLGVSGEDAIFIGDGETDILAAVNAGIDNAAVLWGYRDRDILEKAGAMYFVNTLGELEKLILGE